MYTMNDPINNLDPDGKQTVTYNTDGSRTVSYNVKLTGSGATETNKNAAQKVAGEIKSPSGPGVSVELNFVNSGADVEFDVSPGQDFTNFDNGQGEGLNLGTQVGHLDSTRSDIGEVIVHDTLHAGKPGKIGAIDRYSVKKDSSGKTISSTPDTDFENNIMGTTSGRELTNKQVTDEIEPVSRVIK